MLNHRLPPTPIPALSEWQAILLGTSSLWAPITPAQRELIRSVFNYLNLEILKRARPPASTFNFSSASIGNVFLTGARLFTGSFESAIYLMSLVGGVDELKVGVISAINTNFSHHISAGLVDQSVIIGQNAISHPSAPTALPSASDGYDADSFNNIPKPDSSDVTIYTKPSAPQDSDFEDASPPFSLPTLRSSALHFSKTSESPLPAPIRRIWYINTYGQDIHPSANPKAISVIKGADTVIYSIGSLFTSIIPVVILRGIAEALAEGPRFKILLLNGALDRETGAGLSPPYSPMTALDFVAALVRGGEESRGAKLDEKSVTNAEWTRYITHLIFLDGPGAPQVEREKLMNLGIECVRVLGRKASEKDGGMRYSCQGLVGALEAILGKGPVGRSRRNSLVG